MLTAGLIIAAPMTVSASRSGVNTSLSSDEGTQGSGGVVNFTGQITEESCDVTTDSKNKTVDLGSWAKSYFSDHNETTPREFKINVEECPDSVTSVAVLFDGAKNAADSTLLQLTQGNNTASGVGVRLYNSDRATVIKPGSVSTSAAPDNGNAELTFYAGYIADGAEVQAGEANAVSNFLMVYN